MAHILDNPVWNALISGNQSLAEGEEQVKYFAADVSPFVGMETATPQAFDALHALMPFGRPVAVVSPDPLVVPARWQVVRQMRVWQMVQETPHAARPAGAPPTPLGPAQVPAMLALTGSTNPGPFFSNTIAFGHYQGIFDGDMLVAMAGQRLHPVPYAEISAVCTHPEYLGRGYASRLLCHQAERIWAAGGIPFLHVRTDNATAIKVYQSLGFVARREMSICILQKNPE